MIWFNNTNKMYYTVEMDVVLCRKEGQEWKLSVYDKEPFLEAVKRPRFTTVTESLENK